MAPRLEHDFLKAAAKYARCSLASLREMVQALEHANSGCTGTLDNGKPCKAGAKSDNPEAWHDAEQARRCIEEDALSVEVRNAEWHTPGGDNDDSKPTEYAIPVDHGRPCGADYGRVGRASSA